MFWYGLTFEDVMTTPSAALETLVDRLPKMQAELKMLLFDVMQTAVASAFGADTVEKRVNQWWETVSGERVVMRFNPQALAAHGVEVFHVNGGDYAARESP